MALRSIIICVLLCASVVATAQPADSVVRFVPGVGQSAGQGPAFYPMNILRGPDPAARVDVPSVDPREVMSLGMDGTITLGWKGLLIVDGPGPDLRIVENAFRFGARVYAEPARVEVSSDGVDFTPFPFDSATLAGCAGVTPGGDDFDLATIGVDSVRWVRITDVTRMVLDDPSHSFYDPTLSGFDLDVVVALQSVSAPLSTTAFVWLPTRELTVSVATEDAPAQLHFYDVIGTLLSSQQLETGTHTLTYTGLPPGCYYAVIVGQRTVHTVKVLR
jgi:hypothetical protein